VTLYKGYISKAYVLLDYILGEITQPSYAYNFCLMTFTDLAMPHTSNNGTYNCDTSGSEEN